MTLLKQGRKLSGKKRKDAERLGITTATQEGTEEMLYDLELLRGQFELIGSYPDLVAQAQMWDGQTQVDPVGQYLERAREYMNLPADEVAERINDAKRKLDALDATDADFERKEEELEEEISLLQTFGCRENMGFEQARRACGVMTEMVLLGRAKWKEKLQAERRRANYDRAQISRNFRTKLADVQRTRAKTDAKEICISLQICVIVLFLIDYTF